MRKSKTANYQNKVLKVLAQRIDDFYLAGGTALSLFYFQHRVSVDLDFFTKTFSYSRIKEISDYLEKILKTKIGLIAQNLEKGKTKMVVYNISFGPKDTLRIDFVEDALDLIKRPKKTEGINILSLEDIYLRKIYALVGMIKIFDGIGREKFIGGRAEAKDFYDLYFLSYTFMPFSKFVDKYCSATIKEGIIRWFHTFDRMEMMDGILTVDTESRIDYKKLEKHFKKEIDKIIEKQIGEG